MGALFSQSVGQVAQAGLLAVGMVVVVLCIDPVLGLLSICTLPPMLVLSAVFRRRVKAQARVRRAQDGQIASLAGEALSAMAVVKAFGSERFESDRVRSRSEERMAAGVRSPGCRRASTGSSARSGRSAPQLVLVAGALRVAAGAIGPGELLVFVSYTRKAHGPMRSIAREATKIAAAMARAERVAELLAEDEVLEERPGAHRGGRARGDVALEGVSFAYGDGRPALRDVALRIAAGERVALTGPSGAGKSTLLALIARFHDPAEGRVLIDGRDARDCSLAWLREQVAIVLQDTVLFTGTVRDNIAYGCDASPARVEEVARAAAAHEFITRLPLGYDTELGPQGVGLSGGQRQRIGIARTLLRNPPILLLDEPTTGLDAESEASVLEGLATLMRGRTTILVTHSQRLARTADRIVELAGGRIATRAAAGSDAALPQLERLLDGDAMHARARALARRGSAARRRAHQPRGLQAGRARSRSTTGRTSTASAATRSRRAWPGCRLAERARRPRYRELARRAGGRSPGAPVSYDDSVGALITWLPFDPRLPALVLDGGELGRRLGVAGGEPELIGYKPRARAVLRLGEHVLKAYGSERQFEAALRRPGDGGARGTAPDGRVRGDACRSCG